HLMLRLLIARGELEARLVEGSPAAVTARKRRRRRLADMADAERVDEPLQRNLASRRDGAEGVSDRGFAKSLHLLAMDFFVARLQREDVGRLPHPFPFIEKLDLLLAQPLDVEGAAGYEMLEVLDGLKRAGEFAAAAGDRALLSGRCLFTHHLRVQMAW